MKKEKLICIGCPMGCNLTVSIGKDGQAVEVVGNTCKKGEIYGKKEVTDPRRTVTSTVKILKGNHPVLSVKTNGDIPKDKIKQCMKEIKKTVVSAPITEGEIVVKDVAGTGVNVIATKNIKKTIEI